MASILKPIVIQYHGPDGKKCRSDTPGAVRSKIVMKHYYGQYKDATGKVCRVPLNLNGKPCTDKRNARERLDEILAEVSQEKRGHNDPFAPHRGRPLTEHLADFRAHLLGKNSSQRHVDFTGQRIRMILDNCNLRLIADLSTTRVVEYLDGRRRADVAKKERGFSFATSNHYLRAFKSFTRWLHRDGRADRDYMHCLSQLNAKLDPRRVRRALSQEEFGYLLDAMSEAPDYRGLDGRSRFMLYQVAAYTGYRVSELASVTPASFSLNDPPTLEVAACYSKRRRCDQQRLPSFLVTELRKFLADIPEDDRVWPGTWTEKAAKMIRNDMARARGLWIDAAETEAERIARADDVDFLAFKDGDGRVFDFHALRGQCITSLGRAGVPLTTAQKLARHSDPKLTSNLYTHLGIADMEGAVESLPLPKMPTRKGNARQPVAVPA